MKFVVMDPALGDEHPLFAWGHYMEGWVFTADLLSATRFRTEAEAEKAIQMHYPEKASRLRVCPVSK